MLRIEPAAADDVDFLWEMLFYASHSHHERGVTIEDIKKNPDLIRHLGGWGRAGDVAVIARLGDRRVGACWLRLFLPSESNDVTYFDAVTPELVISVEPDLTGTGVGSALLERVLADADAGGPRTIVLSARASNPAIALYERHGFEVIDTVVNRVGSLSVKMLRRV